MIMENGSKDESNWELTAAKLREVQIQYRCND